MRKNSKAKNAIRIQRTMHCEHTMKDGRHGNEEKERKKMQTRNLVCER